MFTNVSAVSDAAGATRCVHGVAVGHQRRAGAAPAPRRRAGRARACAPRPRRPVPKRLVLLHILVHFKPMEKTDAYLNIVLVHEQLSSSDSFTLETNVVNTSSY